MSKLKQVLQQQAAAKAAQEAHEAQAAVATTPTLSWKDKLQASVAAPVAAVAPVAPVAPVVPQVQSPEEAGQDAFNGYVYRVTYHQKDGLDEARIKKCRIDLHQNIISICEDCSYEYLIYRFSVLELFDNLGVSIFRTKNEACKALASHVLNTWS